jgi:hypothetical protein
MPQRLILAARGAVRYIATGSLQMVRSRMGLARSLLKPLLPGPARRAMRDWWEDARDWLDTLAFGLHFLIARKPLPQVILYFGFALGDDLLCTAALRELRNRGCGRVLMISDHRELFVGNPDAAYVRPLWKRYDRHGSTVAICQRFVRIWGGRFARLEYAPMVGPDRRRQPLRHIVAEMCAAAGVTGKIDIRPYMNLSVEEITSARWACDVILIQSSCMNARHAFRNKEWFLERFHGVVEALRNEITFVQIGVADDPPLPGVRDLRGTTSLRETASLLHHARLFVGLEGFLAHLARAVDCPSVIILGGRNASWQIGYSCNSYLSSALPCSPCWRESTCDTGRACMKEVTVTDVVAAIRRMLARVRNPLAVDTVFIPGAEEL